MGLQIPKHRMLIQEAKRTLVLGNMSNLKTVRGKLIPKR